jgi:amino acid transporter
VLNGALIQFIMASRVLYGMARQGWLPPGLGRVNHRTRTPVFATALISLLILILALSLPLVELANITSLITLSMFALVNAALWRVKQQGPAPAGVPDFPVLLPMAGLVACLGFIGVQLWQWVA